MYIKSITFVIAAIVLSTNSKAAMYDFYQGGFTDGAFVSGTFTANDLDFDNQISTFEDAGELTDFTMSFSGNSIVSAFSVDFSTSNTELVYDLSDGVFIGDDLFPSNPEAAEGIAVTSLADAPLFGSGQAVDALSFTFPLSLIFCGQGGECGLISGFGDSELGVFDVTYEMATVSVSSVPVPAAVWLFGSGLLGLVGVARHKKA